MTLVAVVSERLRVERQLREQSVRDPLTGLANYGKLTEVIGSEIRRSERTKRPFAVLFLDVDDLKKINDRFGHLVGSEALCRVGNALRASCRSIDTAARFGGDEFAIVLPETDREVAVSVADRLSQQVANDGREPPISVSIGIGIYPLDGETVESLLDAADQLLYEAKRRRTPDRQASIPVLPD
jgi:diguanylate cyclase (GGDEF)-like protein